jgi:very-short-patch-repair endonuclease
MLGFHNARFWDEQGNLLPDGRKGRKRKTCYGKLEIDFVEAIGRDWLKANNVVHEMPFRGSIGTYHIDFYVPSKKLAIETDPELHTTYEPVRIRDIRRTAELADIHGVRTLRVLPETLYNPEKIQELKEFVEGLPNDLNTMDAWV